MSERTEKVSSQLAQMLSEILARDIEMPEDSLATVTEVEVSADLAHATAWISILPMSRAGSGIEAIRKQAGHIRKELAKWLSMRVTPKIFYRVDDRQEHAAKIEKLIDESLVPGDSGR